MGDLEFDIDDIMESLVTKSEDKKSDLIVDELIGDEVQQYELAKKNYEEISTRLNEASHILETKEKAYLIAKNKYKREFHACSAKIFSDNEVESNKALIRAKELKKKWGF